jgi:hypothetical protein
VSPPEGGDTGAVLSDAQAQVFDRSGIVKLDQAFDPDSATAMRDVVWAELRRRHGIERADPATWDRHLPTGLRTSKRSRVFEPILSVAVCAALDRLLGESRWLSPKHFGNVLVTMPNSTEYRVPHRIWHSDFPPTLPTDRLSVVKLWALFDEVAPGGAGTPQLSGSHRLFAQYVAATRETDYKRAKFGFLRSHPWLRALTVDDGDPRRNAIFMDEGIVIDGVEVRVVECTGSAGDVFITHPWVFHSIADNATERPRFMRSAAIWAGAAATVG